MVSDGKAEQDTEAPTAAVAGFLRKKGLRISKATEAELDNLTPAEATEALRKFSLSSDGLDADSFQARRVFGNWLLSKVEIRPILMSWWTDSIAAAQRAVAITQAMVKRARRSERQEAARRMIEAVTCLTATLDRFTRFAVELGALGRGHATQRLLPPDFSEPQELAVTNVNISISNDKQAQPVAIAAEADPVPVSVPIKDVPYQTRQNSNESTAKLLAKSS